MLKSITAALKLSEIREKLNDLNAIADPTDAQKTEERDLLASQKSAETEYRKALQTEDDARTTPTAADAESRERLELRSKARFGRYLAAALSGRAIDGPEAEYGEALGLIGNGIPLDLFEHDRPLEVRADAATTVPSTAVGTHVGALQPFVFSESIAPSLGIDMPTVPSGAHTEARISVSLSAGPKTKGAAQESTAATIVGVTAKPRRIASRLTVQIEDVALFGNDSFEAALRENARAALSDAYDAQCITGNGSAPNISGLVKQLTDPENPTDVATFDLFLAAAAEGIDGKWAKTLRDVNLIVGVATYKLAATQIRGVESTISAASYLAQHCGRFATNARMPAVASTIQTGIIFRSSRPGLRTAVHPTWGQIVVDDIYTDSASGQRHFTISVLVGDKVLIVQPDAYGLVEFKVS